MNISKRKYSYNNSYQSRSLSYIINNYSYFVLQNLENKP